MVGLYKIPQEVWEGIGFYKKEVERFICGEAPLAEFKPFRVSWGVYGQREKGTYMVRIRVPAGGLTSAHMVRIADLSEKYGNGIPHITTRQDVQVQWVKIEGTVNVLEGLAQVGLVTRGGGGNTMRNVTACARSGVCDREVFDVAPYATALTEHFLTNPMAYTLPRKFKMAFSGCSADCALSTVNDLGFIAKKKVVDGVEKYGFSVFMAGGMGAHSRVADLLEDFIEVADVPYVAEAVMRLFDKHGNRRNKHKARLRFVMERLGYERFVDIYRDELQAVKRKGTERLRIRDLASLKCADTTLGTIAEENNDIGFQQWLASNVLPQRQKGYYTVMLRLLMGDIKANKLRELARLVIEYGVGSIRATQTQNFEIRWVQGKELYPLFQALSSLELARLGADSISDIICCPGATTCNLGICHSRGMAHALIDGLEDGELPLSELKEIDIRVSGCPNSCGQHSVAGIGLYGGSRRTDNRLAPYYQLLIGGHVEEGKTRLAEPCGFIPAKAVPNLIKELLARYLKERGKGEGFNSYVDRRGMDDAKKLVKRYSVISTYEEDRSFYFDWGKTEEFSLAGLGPGECGAGVFDMIESDIENAGKALSRAMEANAGEVILEEIYRALALSSKALLVTQGVDPRDDRSAFQQFEEKFVKPGLVSSRYHGLSQRAAGLLFGEALPDVYDYASGLVEEVAALYASLDDSLRFTEQKLKEKTTDPASQEVSMDLRGVACPMNYMKAKLQIEEMELGQTIFLYLDEGEPIYNVPVSLQDDGQDVLKVEKMGDFYRLLVRKAV